MIIFLTLVVGVFTLWLVRFIAERKRLLKFMSKFDGPPRNVVFGIALEFPPDPVDIFRKIVDFHKDHGKNLGIWGLLNDASITVGDAADVETILSSNKSIMKSKEYDFLHEWLGSGLLVSFGKKWHSRRKIITPTFHFKILEQFIDIFNKQTTTLVEKVQKYSTTKEEVDIYKYTTLCALDIICEASMGISIDAQDNPDTEYVQAVKQMSMIIFKRVFSLSKQFKWIFPFTALHREQRKVIKVLHAFTDKIIKQRRELLKLKHNENNQPNDGNESKKLNFLDLLLQATSDDKPLSDADVREEVDTFMFEGHDTTTSGIAFTLYHLSKHPEIQDRVYSELQSLIDSRETYLSHRILQELKYLELVIKESLRMTPPVPMIARRLGEETIIQGVKVPAGTNITLPVFAMHYFEDIFPEPEKFDPERFTLENSKDRNPYAYVPFSAGPRNCIGQKFAMLEVKTVVAKMLLNYKLLPASPQNDIRLQADLVLKSTSGVKIRLETRV